MTTETETPITEFQIVDPLAVEIQTAWEKTRAHYEKFKEVELQTKTEYCKCGDLLAAAKERHRNGWSIWMEANLPTIPAQAANICISTAKKARIVGVENIVIHQRLLQFSPEDRAEEEIAPHINRDPDGTKWFSFFERAVGCFAKQIEFRPVQEWTEAERVAFKRRAEPIVKVWGEL
jgi:hypothetical protein